MADVEANQTDDRRAAVTAIDPDPSASSSHPDDPGLAALRAPLSSAMTSLYARTLNWRVEEPYHLLNGRVNSRWDWGGGRSTQEIVGELRSVLAADPKLKAEFEANLATDPKFAANPSARMRWFYQRSPYYDDRYLLYPVGIER